MALLPGQQLINGVSNFIFGSNMSQDFAAHTTRNTPAIQSQIKAGNFQLMRCAIPANSTDAYLDLTANACQAMGCAMLAILIHDNLTWNKHLVTYLGSRCMLYEFANEPDLYPASGTDYLGWWNSQIPALRAINPGAAYIGPVLGVFANLTSFVTPWLQGCLVSGVLPNAISYHVYPCTGGVSQANCAPKANNFSSCFSQVDALVKSILGYSLPQCLTEWNIDAASPPASYTQDPAFCGTWTTTALNNMVQAGFAMACQWDAGGGAAGGLDDLISTQSPYPPQVQYQPMVNVISSYLSSVSNSRLVGPDTPIGVTIGTKTNAGFSDMLGPIPSTLVDLNTHWLRWQAYWNAIEKSKGVFTWGKLDEVVQQSNAAGINLLLTVLQPPAWWLISATATDGSTYQVPSPQGTLQFALALCQRYDGNHGFGIIQGVELGNEDYDLGAARSYVPLANTMNLCYPQLKNLYPTLVVGPGATLQRNASHIQYFWNGMWSAAAGHFDYINHHPYTCHGATGSYDPSNDTFNNLPSFPHCLAILQQCNATGGDPTFPIWLTEIGFACNTNYGRPYPQCVVDQNTMSNYLQYCFDQFRTMSPTPRQMKIFYFNLNFNNNAPTNGVGTSDGMSVYQGIPGKNGFQTVAYTMIKNYSENWGGGTTTTKTTKDIKMRVRFGAGSGTNTLDIPMRVGFQTVTTLRIKDIAMRVGFAGVTIYDTFVRANQPQWGNATDGETWVQAQGSATPSIISNKGSITGAAGGPNIFRLGVQTLADAETQVRFTVSAVGDIIGLTLRDQGLTSFVRLRQTGNQLQLTQQTPAGGFVILATSAFGVLANTPYWAKFRAVGNLLYGKIWADGTNEPANWMASAITIVTGAGQVGLAISLGAAGDVAAFDHFTATSATNQGVLPNTQVKDIPMRVGIQNKTSTQIRDIAMRVRFVDLSLNTIVVTTYAAKRKPLERRFPKS